jgi:hypothetical protein
MIFRVFILIVAMTLITSSCKNAENDVKADNNALVEKANGLQPEITFESTEHDFGTIKEGEQVGWYFKFTNTGGSDLIITNATASCGCTVPEYSREPVPPGKEGTIKVVFDSQGRSGTQMKSVTIESNANTLITNLNLKAEIIGNK